MSSTDLENGTKEKYKIFSTFMKIQVSIAVVALFATIIVSSEIVDLIGKKAAIEKKIGLKEKELREINARITAKEKLIADLTPSALKGLGFKSDSSQQASSVLGPSLKTQKAAKELAERSSDTDRARRKRITIQFSPKYLDKDVNINIVVPSLQEFGFRVMKKKPKIEWMPTNAIWFGTNVEPVDVKLVAYTLLSAGIKIKTISPFRSPNGRKASLIQIGAKPTIDKWPEYTAEDIRNKEIFTGRVR